MPRVGRREIIDVVVAVANAPVSLIAAAINYSSGAHLRLKPHLVLVCHGGWLAQFAPTGGAWAMGNVVSTSMTPTQYDARPRMHEHEWRHSVQWAVLGPVLFPVLYGIAELAYPSRAQNPFERLAGLADGGYVSSPEGRKVDTIPLHELGRSL